MISRSQRLTGLLLGGAVGDALGLPAEGLSPARQQKWWPGHLRHRFFFGRGMCSDDTEHAFMTAQALLESGHDVERFRRSLAWKLRWWFLALPAGVGFATARACVRLWFGVPPERSGVRSAGNGPTMRSAILGAMFAEDTERRREFVRASTRLTHLDPRAETAALAVAEAAAAIVRDDVDDQVFSELLNLSTDPEWQENWRALSAALTAAQSVEAFAASCCPRGGVSGYAFSTMAVALFAWLRHRGDFSGTVQSAIRCGGDTDTVAAIAGSLAGAEVGPQGIPSDWIARLCDWPRSVSLLEGIGRSLANGSDRPVRWFWPGILPRNLFFLLVVLCHGFRRCAPPY